jgi:hypothetical protein
MVAALTVSGAFFSLGSASDSPAILRGSAIQDRMISGKVERSEPVKLAAQAPGVSKNLNPGNLQPKNFFPLAITSPRANSVYHDVGVQVQAYTDHREYYPDNEQVDLSFHFLYDQNVPQNKQPQQFYATAVTNIKTLMTGQGYVPPAYIFKGQRGTWQLSVCYNSVGRQICNSPIQFLLAVN